METQSYGDFSQEVHEQVLGQRIPVGGMIEVTCRCPLRCVHCYNNLPIGDQQAGRSELTFEEHLRILDEITAAGCLWLTFTGGEIFVRKDFLDIYSYAKQKGLLITLFTNGILINEKIADYLAEWRPFSIEITLYGRTRETYERITGIPGSYERCMGGIRLLMERGLPVKLKTMAVTFNRHEIYEMRRYVKEDLGLNFKFDSMINPRIDLSKRPLSVRLTPEEIVGLDLHEPELEEVWKKLAEEFNKPAPSTENGSGLYHCGGGLNSFAINPSGMLSLCVISRHEAWDLRKGSFREGWENFLLKVRRKRVTRQNRCVACEIKATCGMCPANGELENGDPEVPVDFLCHLAHLRTYALGLTVPPHGECEYCRGGRRHDELMQSAAAIKNGKKGNRMPMTGDSTCVVPAASETECVHLR